MTFSTIVMMYIILIFIFFIVGVIFFEIGSNIVKCFNNCGMKYISRLLDKPA